MCTLTLISTNNNTSNAKNLSMYEATVKNVEKLVTASLEDSDSFQEYEKTMLDICNAVGRDVLQRKLQKTSRQYTSEYILVDGQRYKRFTRGTVEYHSLCGSVPVERYTYRQTGVRNGTTVVPLDLHEQLVARTTPALAYRIALGDAQCPGRQWEEQLHASCRQPPSRSTLERIAKKIGTVAREKVPVILQTVRNQEPVYEEAVALSIGLDRTTIPMEEKLHFEGKPPLKRRKSPYIRKAPWPVEVNYRMAYVGTVSLTGQNGECIHTYRYGCSADVNPAGVLREMTNDVIHLQSLRRKSGCKELPMAIVQDGAPEMWTLVESAVEKALPGRHFHKAIDRYHLAERLAESLKALKNPFVNRDIRMREWAALLDSSNKAIDDIEKFILKHLKRLKKLDSMSNANAETLRIHLTYIKNNKHLMRYATLRNKGLPTGSGATEGACKSLIMIRAKRCGQRWHSEGVNAVLTLRSLYQNGRLESFWNEMTEQNHVTIKTAA
jgi:hypothetical protein